MGHVWMLTLLPSSASVNADTHDVLSPMGNSPFHYHLASHKCHESNGHVTHAKSKSARDECICKGNLIRWGLLGGDYGKQL
ncbi:hypothetical protein F5148DRAFT_890302 [Russula earlei]|uniref:Uncharacterized protein n=1 Tax=Russula earlei TaxID=71964 RepID=A0ACC0TSI9_9AGAM|nr:hypothetical protein F5148DRAFT_890302 [Russula earlei]